MYRTVMVCCVLVVVLPETFGQQHGYLKRIREWVHPTINYKDQLVNLNVTKQLHVHRHHHHHHHHHIKPNLQTNPRPNLQQKVPHSHPNAHVQQKPRYVYQPGSPQEHHQHRNQPRQRPNKHQPLRLRHPPMPRIPNPLGNVINDYALVTNSNVNQTTNQISTSTVANDTNQIETNNSTENSTNVDTNISVTEIETPINSTEIETPLNSNEIETPAISNETENPVIFNETETPVFSNETETPVISNETETPTISNETEAPIIISKTKPTTTTPIHEEVEIETTPKSEIYEIDDHIQQSISSVRKGGRVVKSNGKSRIKVLFDINNLPR